jgi:hypothetical protein
MVVRMVRITVETDTIMVLRHARTERAWCPGCRADVEVITLDGGSLPETKASAQIREWHDTGNLHLWQTAGGPVRLCLASLLRCFEPDKFRNQ